MTVYRPELCRSQLPLVVASVALLWVLLLSGPAPANETNPELLESLEYLHGALGRAESIADTNQIAAALIDLGHVHRALGHYDQANASYQRSIVLAMELSDDLKLARSLVGQGVIHRLEGRPEKAVAFLEHAYNIIQPEQALLPARDCLLELSNAYEDLGDHRRALESYKLYKATNDSVFSADGLQKVAELRTRYELEHQKHEIAIREHEEALGKLNREQGVLVGSILIGVLVIVGLSLFLAVKHGREKTRTKQLINRTNEKLELQKTELEATL
ncbi:MAG: tetratricopeptide repeat protein, partial [bacterium]